MNSRNYRILLQLMASLGVFTTGVFFTTFNASLSKTLTILSIPNDLSIFYTISLSGAVAFGAIFGALIASFTLNVVGRKWVFVMADILAITGCVMSIFPSITIMTIGRALCGLACGINLVAVPLYVREISKLDSNERTTPLFRIFFTSGVLLTFLLAYIFREPLRTKHSHWQAFYITPAVFNLIRLVFFLLFVKIDTPAYYFASSEEDKAFYALAKLYPINQIDRAYQQERRAERLSRHSNIFNYENYKQSRALMLLTTIGQLMGANALLFYSTIVFTENKHSHSINHLGRFQPDNLCLGVVLVLMTLIFAKVIRKVPRRVGLIAGVLVLTALALAIAWTDSALLEKVQAVLVMAYMAIQALFGLVESIHGEELMSVPCRSIVVVIEMICTLAQLVVIMTIGVKYAFICFAIAGLLSIFPICKLVKNVKNSRGLVGDSQSSFNDVRLLGEDGLSRMVSSAAEA